MEQTQIKRITIQMYPDNIEKILSGKKTTTVRSADYALKVGLNINESGAAILGGREVIFTCRGRQTIQQAGGMDQMLKSEGMNNINDCKFAQTKHWMRGYGTLVVYDIKLAQ